MVEFKQCLNDLDITTSQFLLSVKTVLSLVKKIRAKGNNY